MTIVSEIEYFLVFEAVLGSGDFTDIAIDDINLVLGEKCDLAPPQAQPNVDYSIGNCDFDQDLCAWKSSKEG